MQSINGVIIVGTARSGTSAVYRSIANELMFHNSFYEPWHTKRIPHLPIETFTDKMSVVKSLVHQRPGIEKGPLLDYRLYETFDFYNEMIPKFDKAVLMARKDVSEAAISYQNALYNKDWHIKYNHNIDPVIETFNLYKKWNKTIMDLSNALSIPITYYEDLFYKDNSSSVKSFINRLGIEVQDMDHFYSYYDSKNRYRQI
jgi:hypothetical protein